MPLGAISPEVKRQAKPLADIKTQYEDNIPFDLIDIDNYRKKKSDEYLADLADSIYKNGLLQEPGLIKTENGRYKLAFGQCRVLSCRDFLNEAALRRAKVWPSTALPYIREIALVENMQRQNTTLKEEVEELRKLLDENYQAFQNPVNSLSEQLGKSAAEIRNKLVIFDTAQDNEKIAKILDEEIIKDYKSIYNLSQAIENADSGPKRKRVEAFLDKVIDRKFNGNMREAADKLRKYAKGKVTTAALPASVTDKPEAPQDQNQEEASTPVRKSPITAKVIEAFSKKIEACIEDDITDDIREQLTNLQSKINERL